MRAPKVHTGNMTQARKFANIALAENRTTNVDVLVSKLGSLEACKTVAVGIQRSFCSMRVQERNKVASKMKNSSQATIDVLARTPYDDLACRTLAIPDDKGYRVIFEPADNIMDLIEVSFEDGSKPAQLDSTQEAEQAASAKYDDIIRLAIKNIKAVSLHDFFWVADYSNATPGLIFGHIAEAQKLEQWFADTVVAAWNRRGQAGEPQATTDEPASEPTTEKTAIDEQLDALGDDMFS